MPVVARFNGSSLVYVWEQPAAKTRSGALACEVSRADLDAFLIDEVERAHGGAGIAVAVLPAAYPIHLGAVGPPTPPPYGGDDKGDG